MRLRDLPGNPAPPGALCGAFLAEDGVALRFARWPAAGPARGTVCVFQGRGETIEKYYEVVGDLTRRGFAVATLDWRGQGGSDRLLPDPRRGYVEDYGHYERDLQAFRRQVVLPDCPPPFFALAHSTGAHVVLRAAARLQPWINRAVLVAPLLDFVSLPFSRQTVYRIVRLACAFGLGDRYAASRHRGRVLADGFEGNVLTSDRTRFQRLAELARIAPDLVIGRPTLAWVYATLRSIERLEARDAVERLSLPMLIVTPGADRLVSTRAIERLAGRLRSAGHVLVPGARHDLLIERDVFRDQFWAAFDAFVPGSAARASGEPSEGSFVGASVA